MLWTNTRLSIMETLANCCFEAGEIDEGFRVFEDAVTLFENFFALPDETVLSYGNVSFDCLTAKTVKNVYYHITEFTGLIAASVMMDLKYVTPVAHVNQDEKIISDMEHFEGEMVSSTHILRCTSWAGFERVKDDERYAALLKRVRNVALLENDDNLFLMLRQQAKRIDDCAKDAKWY